VRSLAQRSSQAAKDIEHLITNSGNQVKEGVALVNEAGNALNEIVASIRDVATLVSDIARASAEQATGLEEVGKALAQMDEVTQRNSALVEENAATAQTLEEQAKSMDEHVSFFRTGEAEDDASATAVPAPRRAAQRAPRAAEPAAPVGRRSAAA
jgi:methyl-accepting chemotaxis protein